MVTNPKAKELEEKGKVEYDNFTWWPHYHKEKMNWASGVRIKANSDIIVIAATVELFLTKSLLDTFAGSICKAPYHILL